MEVKSEHSEVDTVFLSFLLFPLADVGFSETALAEVPALSSLNFMGLSFADSDSGRVNSYADGLLIPQRHKCERSMVPMLNQFYNSVWKLFLEEQPQLCSTSPSSDFILFLFIIIF